MRNDILTVTSPVEMSMIEGAIGRLADDALAELVKFGLDLSDAPALWAAVGTLLRSMETAAAMHERAHGAELAS